MKTPREPEEEPSDTEEGLEDFTEVEDKSMIPRVISFTDSPLLPAPKAEPVVGPK